MYLRLLSHLYIVPVLQSHDDWVWLTQEQLKHMYLALATATHKDASFVLLCSILEFTVGIWSCFDVFAPTEIPV